MTLLLDLVQQAEAILLTALKQLIPCEVIEIQTVPARRQAVISLLEEIQLYHLPSPFLLYQ